MKHRIELRLTTWQDSKLLMGFSDISTLHLEIYAQTGLVTFHGNMVMYYFGMQPQEYNFPIVRTDNFGHNAPNTTLPVGTQCRLDADSATLELIEPCVQE